MEQKYLPAVEQERAYLKETRRYLHRHPELSLQEYGTAEYIRKQLSDFDIPWRAVGETGTLGYIDGGRGPGRTILLRADIDALPIEEKSEVSYRSEHPGVMHACGHDVHTAALLGAAKVLASLRQTFAGRVLLVFQQAEEFGHGSHFFVDEGLLGGIDRAFGCHISPEFPCGTIALSRGVDASSCAFFRITIKGRSAHISKPHQGADALGAAAQLLLQLPAIKAGLDPFERAVIGVGKLTGGTTYNVIAQEAVLEGTLRTLSDQTHRLLQEKITEVAEMTARMRGCQAEVTFETFASVLSNDPDAREEVKALAEDVLGPEHVYADEEVLFGFAADDFSALIQETKGVYVHVGTADPARPETSLPIHSDRLDVDEEALLVAADLHVRYALSVLKEEEDERRIQR